MCIKNLSCIKNSLDSRIKAWYYAFVMKSDQNTRILNRKPEFGNVRQDRGKGQRMSLLAVPKADRRWEFEIIYKGKIWTKGFY